MPDGLSREAEFQIAAPADTGSGAAGRLLANKERILSVWEERLRQEVAAAGREPHHILINTLPVILHQLAEAMSPHHPRATLTQGSTVAHEHGGERVRLTRFRLEDLITEYKILRQVLFEILEEQRPLAPDERNTLHISVDQAITEACTGYVLVQSGLREQFFATLAHDLRSPLSAAQTAAALIALRPDASQVPDLARRITENISRIDRMVRDLLDTMRVESGARLQIDIEPCDLVTVVRDALERLQTKYGARLVLVAPEPVPGHFASDVLQRAVENLTDNAVKYGESSRPITVTVRGTHGRAILTVHNHGAHIPAEQQENLFRAFQRLTDAEASGKTGWGLGLAQARAVAEAHGGSIGVDSLPGHGTTFMIDIPLDARPHQQNPITPSPADGRR